MSSQHIKCYGDGTYTINDKSGDDIELPNCDPIGCDSRTLPFPNLTNKCKKGYHSGEFAHLEQEKNKCNRECTTESGEVHNSNKIIMCNCYHDTKTCRYEINDKDLGLIPWDSIKVCSVMFY